MKSRKKYTILPSPIHGNGVFTTTFIEKDEVIDTGIYYSLYFFPVITPEFGSMINHSYKPSAYLSYNTRDSIYEVRAKNKLGNRVEITIDYNDTPWFIRKPEAHYT